MAKVLPVAGFALSGAIGGLVFCRRGGGVYARAHVIPLDPRSATQVEKRAKLGAAVAAWKALAEAEKEVYRKRARRSGRSGYHLFVGEWLEKG